MIAIIGPGAIGGTLAFALSARHEVVICANQAFETLAITRVQTRERQTVPAQVQTSPAAAKPVDWVLVCVKSHQTPAVAGWLKALVGKNTRVAVLQNGVEHRERVAPLVPIGTTIVPVVVALPAERVAPGEIEMHGGAQLTVPDDDASHEFVGLFDGTFVKASTDRDFKTRVWEKLCLNCAGGALSALTLRPDALASTPEMTALGVRFIQETMAVGAAEGAKFADDLVEQLVAMQTSHRVARGNSMYYDRRDGKPLEWDARNGVVQRLGRKHGIPTPISDVIVPILRSMSPKA
ncbi:MAG: 2-dehydropantoate 2-reductase [Alphaproteobacteria bacterium]|nr:2-dehydropantoate 2-reductase [Alphaproteobacteria bacterium]